MLASGSALALFLHVPPTSSTIPTADQLELLREGGVQAILTDPVDTRLTTLAHTLPSIHIVSSGELVRDGKTLTWLHGNREQLLGQAASLSNGEGISPPFAVSLPEGSVTSIASLQRVCTLCWQLHAVYGCKATVLRWCELQAIVDETGDWSRLSNLLRRMSRPEWKTIHGG